jgi:hypothetical protein
MLEPESRMASAVFFLGEEEEEEEEEEALVSSGCSSDMVTAVLVFSKGYNSKW